MDKKYFVEPWLHLAGVPHPLATLLAVSAPVADAPRHGRPAGDRGPQPASYARAPPAPPAPAPPAPPTQLLQLKARLGDQS